MRSKGLHRRRQRLFWILDFACAGIALNFVFQELPIAAIMAIILSIYFQMKVELCKFEERVDELESIVRRVNIDV